MSIRVTTAIWDHSQAKLGDRLVLLYIADRCNDDGTGAYPSIETIVGHCHLSERSVQMSIKRLIALGEMQVEYGAGPHGVNRYRVVIQGCSPFGGADSAGVNKTTATPAESAPGGCKTPQITPAESAPNTSVNTPPEPSTETPTGYTAEFERFWNEYPKDHGVKKPSFARWKQLSAAKRAMAYESLSQFKAGKRWQEGFIVDCQKYLRNEQFETPPEPWEKPLGNVTTFKPRFNASGQRLLTSADLRRSAQGETTDEPERDQGHLVDPEFRVAEPSHH